ncbi:50S ribosomal protein L11, chloroplastic [Mangifera indica]|uniref:50S ribosomal protein L11, chloroplastic n=1 Tax=Mangifera indica TaxID=29780 RepID=UPI001CF973B9|nr:50S ribosomal protein L11, chloroplastic [Mangifera indica]
MYQNHDKSFTFILKSPPASVLLLKAADMNCTIVQSTMRNILVTISNMGIDVDPPILEPKNKVIP